MKYIRLKDKIYTDNNLYTITKVYEDNRFKVGDKVLSTDKIFEKVEDKDIADTIEELCECFVGIYKDEEEINDKEIAYFLENLSRENYFKEIYGAIWTDKGLIYVAKMNDKGELELLWELFKL